MIVLSSADAWIDQNAPNTNHGSDVDIRVYAGGGFLERSLLRLNFSRLPPGADISSALVWLNYYTTPWGDPAGRSYSLCRLTQVGWVESQITWNSYATGQSWTTPGGDYTESGSSTGAMPGSYGWVQWDITGLAKYFQANSGKIADLYLYDSTSGGSATYGAYFHGRRYVDPSLRPRMEVVFTGGARPGIMIF